MLILQLLDQPVLLATLITTLVVGLTVHEFAHAWTANRLGDPTAADLGRLTLDPRKHLDPLGSLVFLVVGFGWAKPVPINPYRLDHRDILLVALAGPVSNLALALLAAGTNLALGGTSSPPLVAGLLGFFLFLNVVLAVFNMLPIPPLDGWKVVMGLVPASIAARMRAFEYGPGQVALLVLIVASRMLPPALDPIHLLVDRPRELIGGAIAALGGLPAW